MGPVERVAFDIVDVGRKTEAKPGAEGNKVCDRQASGSPLHIHPGLSMKADYNGICNYQGCKYSPLQVCWYIQPLEHAWCWGLEETSPGYLLQPQRQMTESASEATTYPAYKSKEPT